MNPKSESETGTAQEPADSATAKTIKAAASRPRDAPGGVSIDFHSAEFNRTDDLNDYSGDYRSFESLDGVVTADMRHQTERRGHTIDSSVDAAVPTQKNGTKSNTAEADEALLPLSVISEGRTLIIDTDPERAVACAERLSDQGLTCTLLAIKEASSHASQARFGSLALVEASAASIIGAFGGFSATVTVNGERRDLTEWFDKEAIIFDLVLDVQSAPSFAGDRLPAGYYAPGADPASLDEALRELPEMRGRFQKPQFNAFLGVRCIHGRSRARDCRQCITVCPFGAIQSADRKISINHYLCQGCGGCALVCPTDAIRRANPSQEELLKMLKISLESRSADDGYPPTLVISGTETLDRDRLEGVGEKMIGGTAHLEVETGHVGLEMLLAALAYGAGRVIVVYGPQDPPTIRKALERQTLMAGAILRGLGMPEGKIRIAVVPSEDGNILNTDAKATDLDTRPGASPLPPHTFSPDHDKRALVRLATHQLSDRFGAQQSWLPLPVGSPFGAVTVDSAACTLCMACAAACPSDALLAGGDLPRLQFVEARCHQCGLCEESCPEGAIRLLPRMLCNHRAAEMPAVLHEVEPFRCVECGAPFATRAMIDRMRDKLTGHWMYTDERQLRRLQMCGTCRTRDALGSQDTKAWRLS
mgnify:CR=1 FL=1